MITGLAKLLGKNAYYIAIDINSKACLATLATAKQNGVSIDCVTSDLFTCLDKLRGKVDVLLFNPPYVPTEDDEFHKAFRIGEKTRYDQNTNQSLIGVEAAWAGGKNGREILDKLLPYIHVILYGNGVLTCAFYRTFYHRMEYFILWQWKTTSLPKYLKYYQCKGLCPR